MKGLRDFWFIVALIFSIFIVCCCFVYANADRDSGKLGGEVFMIALPIILVRMQFRAIVRESQRKQRRLKRYQARISKAMYM